MTILRLLALPLLVLLAVAAVQAPVRPEPWRPPPGMVLFVASPTEAVLVPERFAREAVAVAQCESRFDPEAIGDQGRAFGLLQVRLDVHSARMREMGLEPASAADRILFAVTLWREQGWRPWTCQP